jgi:sugar lactone lactonase YvrE
MPIEVMDAGLRRIVAAGADIEPVQGGFDFLEGPVWDRRTGSLIFSDIPANTIYRLNADGASEVFRRPSRHTNGNTFDRQGRLLSCEHSGRQVSRTEPDGTITSLATHYEGKRLNSPNDVVCRGDGAIIFTDPPYGILSERMGGVAEPELSFFGVYRLDPGGSLTLLVDDFERPNGLAFSPDERTLFIADTARGHIRSFQYTDDGRLRDERVFAVLEGEGRGRPDGMKLDREGNVYCTGPGGVWVFSPMGALLGKIRLPEQTANLGWGGPDWRTLYLTASTTLYRIRLEVAGIPVS